MLSDLVVRLRPALDVLADLDLYRRMGNPEISLQVVGDAGRELVAGVPAGMNRWQVSVVSVVLIG